MQRGPVTVAQRPAPRRGSGHYLERTAGDSTTVVPHDEHPRPRRAVESPGGDAEGGGDVARVVGREALPLALEGAVLEVGQDEERHRAVETAVALVVQPVRLVPEIGDGDGGDRAAEGVLDLAADG